MVFKNPELGFGPGDAIVAVEYRPPDLNAHNPRIAAQDLASDTRQGRILQGVNVHEDITAVLVDVANTENGQIKHWYTLDASQPYGLAVHDAPANTALQLSAWRLRNLLLENGDPTAFTDGLGYNSYGIRQQLATRPSVLALLNAVGIGDENQIPNIVVEDGQITDLPDNAEVFIKPFPVSDVTEYDPRFRAQLAPNNRAEISRRVQALGGQAILQPRLEVMPVADLLGAVAAPLERDMAPQDPLHTVRLYDFLWLDEDPKVAEIRLTDPRDNVGALYATHSELLEAERIHAAFPDLAALHHEVREGLRSTVGKLGNLAMNYILLPDGEAKIVSVDARAFTPDLTDADPRRQALSRTLAEAEVDQLVVLAREYHRPAFSEV